MNSVVHVLLVPVILLQQHRVLYSCVHVVLRCVWISNRCSHPDVVHRMRSIGICELIGVVMVIMIINGKFMLIGWHSNKSIFYHNVTNNFYLFANRANQVCLENSVQRQPWWINVMIGKFYKYLGTISVSWWPVSDPVFHEWIALMQDLIMVSSQYIKCERKIKNRLMLSQLTTIRQLLKRFCHQRFTNSLTGK